MKTGVYTITNLINGKIYVGSTQVDFNKRYYQHFQMLRNNKHSSKYLQNSYNKYGKSNFKFEILEECLPEFCLSIEQYWINILYVTNMLYGYNTCSVTGTTKGFKMPRKSVEASVLGRKLNGRKFSEETREKMRLLHTNKIVSIETRLKMSNFQKGKVLSKEAILKRILKQQKAILQYDLQGNFIKEWVSAKIAGEVLNIKNSNITMCCKKTIKTAGKFKWKYKIKLQ